MTPPPHGPDAAHLAHHSAWAAGREAHPLVQLDFRRFSTHLAGLEAAAVLSNTPFNLTDAPGLLLACACLDGNLAAIQTLESDFISLIPRHLARKRLSAEQLDEVAQRVRTKLLVPSGTRPPRLSQYRGTGPLGAWMHVVALRAAQSMLRESVIGNHPPPSREPIDLGRRSNPEQKVEQKEARRRYGRVWRQSIESALKGLSSDRRRLLRQRYVDKLSCRRIGELDGVSAMAAWKRVRKVEEELSAEVRRIFREHVALRHSEAESLVKLFVSDPDFVLSSILRTRPVAEDADV